MEPAKKFWSLPELGERLVSYLDPLSVLHLAQSSVMKKKTLQKSLTSKAWIKLIRRSSLQVLDEVDKERERKREEGPCQDPTLHDAGRAEPTSEASTRSDLRIQSWTG